MRCLICSRASPLRFYLPSLSLYRGLHFRRRVRNQLRMIVEKANKRTQFFVSIARRGVLPRSPRVRTRTYKRDGDISRWRSECTCVLFPSTLLVLNNAEHIISITRCEIKRGGKRKSDALTSLYTWNTLVYIHNPFQQDLFKRVRSQE